MPECHVCLGTEFEELDGLFYCLVCQTQSQVIQTVELDETDAAVAAPAGVLREVEKKKSSDSKSVTEFPQKGRPWTLYEAYQIIIQGQVDALIVHGAQPDLKEAVLRLWAKYLSQLGVAFTDDIHLVAKNVGKGARHREKYMGNCQNPVITPVRHKRTTQQLNKYVMSRSATEKEEERLTVSTVLAGETFYEGDNPLLSDDDNSRGSLASCSSWELEVEEEKEEEEEEREEEEEESGAAQNENEDEEEELGRKENDGGSFQNDEGKNREMASCSWNKRQHDKHLKIDRDREVSVNGRQRKRKFINLGRIAQQVEYMDLYKTVAFCYLGLLFVSPGITVSDIIRWVYEGSFPYLEVTSLLPSDMKLFAYDERLFKPRHMTSTGLRLVAGKVARFLGINQFPAFPMKYVISRYILQLDLPIEMIALVHNLCEKAPPDEAYAHNAVYMTSQVSVKNFDAQCVAYIIVMLKLLFGINDSKERELSDYTRRMENIFSLDKLFEWDAWQVHANQKFLLKPQSPWNKSETPDLESTCKAFKTSKYEDRNFSSFHLYTKTKKKKVENYKKENRVLLKRPLDVLLYRWTQREQQAASLHQKMDIEADEESSDGAGESFLGNKTLTNDQTVSGNRDMGARFQRSTLRHITQAKHFWLRQIPDTVLSIDHKRTERVTSSSETGTFSLGSERVSQPQLVFSYDQVLQSETLQLDKEYSKIFEGLEDLVSAHRQYSVHPRPDVNVPKRQKEAARADEWDCEGFFPYLEVTSLLPSDMKLFAYDERLFKPVSVKNFDAQCVAYNIVMLKLLFGINDSKERELSDYTRRMQNIFSLDKKLFEWDACQVHANQKFLLKPQSPWNKSETPDLESTCKAFKTSKYEDRNFSSFHLYTKTKKKKVENYKKENQVLLKRPLDVLLYRWIQRDQRAASLHQKMDIEADEESSDGAGESFLGNKTLTSDQTVSGNRDIGARFQRSTLRHITQAKHFWLRQIPDTVLSIDHKRTERVTSISETGTFSLGRERVSHPQLAFSCDQVLHSETLQLDKEYSKIFEGLEDLVSAHRQYSVHPSPDVNVPKRQEEAARADEYVKYSVTYSWLLAVCSHLCCCPTEEIQDRVFAVESYLLLESEVF